MAATHRVGGEAASASNAGVGASAPGEIPAAGWKAILMRVKSEFAEDQIPLISAGITFYTVLAIFPGLAAFVSLYGLFGDAHGLEDQLRRLAVLIPGGAIKVIGDQMRAVLAAHAGGLSLAFVFGLLVSIWSANGAVKAMMTGLNVAYEEKERRNFVRKTLVSLAFTLGLMAFGLAAVAALGAGAAARASTEPAPALIVEVVSWVVLLAALVAGLALLYQFGPSRAPAPLKWLSPGSAAAVLLWIVLSAAFTVYVANFGHYNKTYGSLGAIIGFMTWLWLSTMVVLAGAELNSEIEKQAARGPKKAHGAEAETAPLLDRRS